MLTLRQPPIGVAIHGLEPLRSELDRAILVALGRHGQMTTDQLAGWLVVPARSPAEGHLERLLDSGAVERREGGSEMAYRLTASGHGLVETLDVATAWLSSHPQRRLEPSSPIGWRAFVALVDAWQGALIEWVVRASPTPAELAAGIDGITSRKLKRELRRLRGAGLVEQRRGRDGIERVRLTDWGRRGFAVLAKAAAWERSFAVGGRVPIVVADAVVALLATLPLVRLGEERSGLVTLVAAAEPDEQAAPRAGMVWALVRRGRVVARGEGVPRRQGDAQASGTFADWLAAVIDGRPALQLGGDRQLAVELVAQLHVALYGPTPAGDPG